MRIFVAVLGLFCFSAGAYSQVQIRGFSEMTMGSENSKIEQSGVEEKNSSDGFTMGGLDLLFTANLGKNLSFLNETVLEVAENENVLDVERTWIKWSPLDVFSIKFGRVHTALGYWNNAYHHGSWFQTPIQRPAVYAFEDDGGILPNHIMGFEFAGKWNGLGYIANIGNGRGITVDPPQVSSDSDRTRAVNLLLYYETPIEGLRVGAVYYKDTLPGGEYEDEEGIMQTATKGDESITGAHLVYIANDLEVISEYHMVNHEYEDTDKTKVKLSNIFVQTGYTLAEVYTPYARYETLAGDSDVSDEYTGVEKGKKRNIVTAGMRWDAWDTAAVKVELAQIIDEIDDPENDSETIKTSVDSMRFNVSWGF